MLTGMRSERSINALINMRITNLNLRLWSNKVMLNSESKYGYGLNGIKYVVIDVSTNTSLR